MNTDAIKILLVEDESSYRILLKKVLETLTSGTIVEEASDGKSALSILREKKFDCIFLDYVLTDTTGIALIKQLRSENISIPTIFLTAYLTPMLLQELLKEGITECISKDKFSRDILTAALEKSLKRKIGDASDPALMDMQSFRGLSGMKLLIVDDTPHNIDILRKMLEDKGLVISAAPNGETALKIASRAPFDLILLDIMMPGINGFETCRRLKADAKTRNIPVIFISAKNEVEDFVQGFSVGAVDYITKPFRSQEVLARISAHLQLSKASKDNRELIENLSDLIESRNRELINLNHELQHAYENLDLRVRESSAKLMQSETSLKGVFDRMVDALIEIDCKGLVNRFNPAAEKLFGYAASEVIGRNVNMLMPEPYRSEHDLYMKRYLSTGHAKIIGIGREVTALKKNGEQFPMDLAVGEIISGETKSFVGQARDITERKKAEMELKLAREKAIRSDQAKSDFLSRMSHELRTPLNAVLGFAQLLSFDRDKHLNQTEKDNLARISSAGKHLLELINEILDLSRIESGNIGLSMESIALESVIKELMEMLAPLASRYNVKLVVEPDNFKNIYVQADKTRLRQILMNLVSNGIKYNHPEGTVSIKPAVQGADRIRILVEDTGIGIPDDKKPLVFQPFTRLIDDEEKIEGTGIGLSISKRLIDLMGGKIGFESFCGKGSSFFVEIIIAEKISRDLPLENMSQSDNDLLTAKIFSILCVDDNPGNLELIRQILLTLNHVKLITAPDARLGMDIALANKPDLIMMDINLPGINGFDALKTLRLTPETKNIPVVAISANAMENDIKKSLKAGFDDYLTKPFDVPVFLEKIKCFIDKRVH